MARRIVQLLFFVLLLPRDGFTDQTEGSESEVQLHRSKRATPCNPNPCQNSRKCRIVGSSYECDCSSNITTVATITTGWKGVNCSEDINECLQTPCFHQGTDSACINKAGTFQCFCDTTKYRGEFCEKAANPCHEAQPMYNYSKTDLDAKKPLCLNNGNCSIIEERPFFKCTCVPGFDQIRCERNIDDCLPKLCKNNGKCIDLIQAYKCACRPGFTGTSCETNIDECKLHNACANNAACTDKINDYECDCTGTGYEGKNCSVEINECDANPCKNGASCTDAFKNYTCSCRPGYTGINCSVDIRGVARGGATGLEPPPRNREIVMSLVVISLMLSGAIFSDKTWCDEEYLW